MRIFRLVATLLVIGGVLVACSSGEEEPESGSGHSGIVLDDDVYGDYGDEGDGAGPEGTYEAIRVTAEASRDVLAAALTSAGQRMMSVGEDGLDHDPDEAAQAYIYTPNYVSDVTFGADGSAELYVDCKGIMEPAMAARFREILVEELSEHGITRAHVRAVTDW